MNIGEKFAQKTNQRTFLIFTELDGKYKEIYTYKISSEEPIPNVGDELQFPKIPHDHSNNNATICEVIKRKYILDQQKGYHAFVLFVSLCS